MASKKPKNGSDADSKTEDRPKFLLVQNDESTQDSNRLEGNQMTDDATSDHEVLEFTGAGISSDDVSINEAADGEEKENWRDRDDIRDDLMDHVRERFGIDKDVAEKAINDILRIA